VRSIFAMPADMYEASLERVYHHTKNSSLVILSAFRSPDERTPEENEAAHAHLREMVLGTASLPEAARLRIAASLTSGPWMKSGCW
jgi:hypothetical protein